MDRRTLLSLLPVSVLGALLPSWTSAKSVLVHKKVTPPLLGVSSAKITDLTEKQMIRGRELAEDLRNHAISNVTKRDQAEEAVHRLVTQVLDPEYVVTWVQNPLEGSYAYKYKMGPLNEAVGQQNFTRSLKGQSEYSEVEALWEEFLETHGEAISEAIRGLTGHNPIGRLVQSSVDQELQESLRSLPDLLGTYVSKHYRSAIKYRIRGSYTTDLLCQGTVVEEFVEKTFFAMGDSLSLNYGHNLHHKHYALGQSDYTHHVEDSIAWVDDHGWIAYHTFCQELCPETYSPDLVSRLEALRAFNESAYAFWVVPGHPYLDAPYAQKGQVIICQKPYQVTDTKFVFYLT